ncbi:TBC1 domain family member 17-like [Dendronephthya gigantea]|uniref:TBC1 domain family member 17-like n=1 Tax=Dendronephthya gigantea TaxID=151771 RepID=UPI00106C2534|nr:TBC1 domain family member 17-like [Dendronephthya gigantea]
MAESSECEDIENSPKIATTKVVYEQADVFVHTSTSVASNYSANIIRGQISIIVKDDSSFVNWIPASTEAFCEEYDINNDAEWSIVSHSTKPEDQTQQLADTKSKTQDIVDKYTLSFETNKLNSIRRSDSKFHWHYLVFILKDGRTLPALHFHSGGTREFIQHLNRYIWLAKSPNNPKLFIVCNEHDHALRKSLNHLQLFGTSDSTDILSRVIGNAYVEGLGAFSKVTKLVRDAWSNAPEASPKPEKKEEHPPTTTNEQNYDSLQSLENGFENLLPDIQPDLGLAPDIVPGEAISMNEWMSFINSEGKVENSQRLKKLIHRGGIEHNLRKELWKFLLGFYDYDQSYKERIQTRKRKWNEYVTMKQQWQTITPQQEKNFSVLRERKHLVDKDVIRTDRKHPFYCDEPTNTNPKKLYDILMTYCMYNFDLGYVQGMSDLLSPILFVMDDEADAFWCFVGFMEMVADNFEMNQAAIHKQLDNLKTLLQYVFPRLYHHFEKNESANLYFCFRWLLILFKREFVFDDVMRLWEMLWTQDLSPNFHLFLCLAILKMQKDVIIERQHGFNEILKHINELSMKINLEKLLIEAEKLCVQLKDVRHLPDEVKEILTGKPVEKNEKRHFPGKPVLINNSTEQTDSGGPSHSGNYSDDEIEVLNEHTADTNNETSTNQETAQPQASTPKTNSEANSEMFVSVVQTQADEELVVLSTNDKAVF